MFSKKHVVKGIRRAFPAVYNQWIRFPKRNSITRILSKEGTSFADSEKAFEDLQNAYPSHQDYGYDPYSTWQRGARRALTLLKAFPFLQTPGCRILEAGCGDGMVGFHL